MAVQRTENRGLRTERSLVAASVLETSVLSS